MRNKRSIVKGGEVRKMLSVQPVYDEDFNLLSVFAPDADTSIEDNELACMYINGNDSAILSIWHPMTHEQLKDTLALFQDGVVNGRFVGDC